ncbi:MAG: hypothetical protein ABI227_12285, partial [Rhodanobacter sp.]
IHDVHPGVAGNRAVMRGCGFHGQIDPVWPYSLPCRVRLLVGKEMVPMDSDPTSDQISRILCDCVFNQ